MVFKPQHIYLSLSMTSLWLALLILLAYLTQAAGIQIISIQSLYWSLDKVWGFERALLNLIVAISTSAIAFMVTRKVIGSPSFKATGQILILTIGGLFLGFACQYTYSCCETPAILHVGFPMSWGYGALGDFNELSYSTTGHLLKQLTAIKWHINPWGLVTDLLYWFNASFIFFTLPRFKQIIEFRQGKPV